jgi:hypothetical protein
MEDPKTPDLTAEKVVQICRDAAAQAGLSLVIGLFEEGKATVALVGPESELALLLLRVQRVYMKSLDDNLENPNG